jgi:hypothetical protein
VALNPFKGVPPGFGAPAQDVKYLLLYELCEQLFSQVVFEF